MAQVKASDISAERLAKAEYVANFSDLHPPLSKREALVESDRCFFCYDAPCQTACPTSIDIPLFIREIASGHEKTAAVTIFNQNILGGMCARVCPTETLCEEACVRNTSEDQPVKIGLLQPLHAGEKDRKISRRGWRWSCRIGMRPSPRHARPCSDNV
jgi:dihydropyrimidine dehydrogenase (NAD+) subunit PreT